MAKKHTDVKQALDYNWAKDKKFADIVMTNLLSIFEDLKSARQGREDVWQQSYRAWSIDKTGADKSYDGMADLSVPQIRKEVQTMTRRLFKALFPEDYLKAEPNEFQDEELAITNTQVLRHYYDNVIDIKKYAMPWILQNVLYGTSPLRSFWETKSNEMMFRKRVPFVDPQTGVISFKSQVVTENVTLYNAPKVRADDLFNTFVYPHHAQTPAEVEMVFSRMKTTRFDLEKKAIEGTCVGFNDFKDQSKDTDHDFEESQERMLLLGENNQFHAQPNNGFYDLLEVWVQLVLPNTNQPVACVVEIVNGTYCTRIQRNPYWHQSIPYDFIRFITPPPGEFYGRGLPEAVISMQHQLDDTMNQTMDSSTLALNAITIINPAYAPNAESFEIEPRAQWWADPNAVKQMTFPDLSDSGYKAAGNLRNMISELSDNQPQLPDPIAGKARSTGQAQLAVDEWQTDVFVIIDLMSREALSPLAYKTHSLLQQYLDENDIIRVTGKYAGTWIERVVTPHDIVGKYFFQWIGALQIENKSLKTQQLLNFMKIFPGLPPEAQSKLRVQWDNLVIKLMRDGFNIKDVYNIVETTRMNASIKPDIENMILDKGGVIAVRKMDDDQAHILSHAEASAKLKDPVKRYFMEKHIQEHKTQMEEKALEVKQAQAMMMAMGQGQPQGGGPQDGGPQGPNNPRGNQGQIPDTPEDQMRGMR